MRVCCGYGVARARLCGRKKTEKEKIFNYIKERAQDLEETYLKELSVLERQKELLSYGIDISLEDMKI